MAYVSNLQQDPEQQTPAQGAVPVGGGAGVPTTPSSGVGSVGAPAAPGQPGQPGAGGGFATLDKYLTANQGQAQPLANRISSGIGQQYNALAGQNASTLGDISGQVASGSVPANASTTLAQEAANPVSFAGDKSNVGQFQGLLNATYGGPLTAQGTPQYATQQNAVNKAIAQGQAQTGTEAGREQLLSQYETAPSASTTGLNAAILSSSPSAQVQVEGAYKPFSGLLTDLYSGAQDVNADIAKQQARAADTSAQANKQIADQTAALNTNVNAALTNANAANTNFVSNYNSLVGGLGYGNSLTSDQVAQLGMTPEQYAALQAQTNLAGTSQYMTAPNFGAPSATTDINNAQFLTQETAPPPVTANQVATPQQFQTLMALMSLNNGQLPARAVLNPSAASQAGTYVAPTLPANAFNYSQALQNATTTEQQERAAAQAQANALSAQAQAEHDATKGGMFGGIMRALSGNPISNALLTYNPVTVGPYVAAKQIEK
jgi:hypothetical protein